MCPAWTPQSTCNIHMFLPASSCHPDSLVAHGTGGLKSPLFAAYLRT